MTKPVLAIMAAGMGSRYGGCKQIDPMDEYGNLIIDFSIYDALRAGFEDVLFIIKHEIEADVRELIGDRTARHANVSYAFQQLDKQLPAGFCIPEGRAKPWGTTHCLLCAENELKGRAFAAINADDYYGPEAYRQIYSFLTAAHGPDEHAMVGYNIENTLTDHGSVARGVCAVQGGMLTEIHERTKVFKTPECAEYEQDGLRVPVPRGNVVSMNFWGFNRGIMENIGANFRANFAEGVAANPLKYEDLLPNSVQQCMADGRATVRVLNTPDKWFGVTYKEDKPMVVQNIQALKAKGVYPEKLWN